MNDTPHSPNLKISAPLSPVHARSLRQKSLTVQDFLYGRYPIAAVIVEDNPGQHFQRRPRAPDTGNKNPGGCFVFARMDRPYRGRSEAAIEFSQKGIQPVCSVNDRQFAAGFEQTRGCSQPTRQCRTVTDMSLLFLHERRLSDMAGTLVRRVHGNPVSHIVGQARRFALWPRQQGISRNKCHAI